MAKVEFLDLTYLMELFVYLVYAALIKTPSRVHLFV